MGFFKGKDGNCVMVGRPCPENGDASKGDYCPCWVEVEERENGHPDGAILRRTDCTHRITKDWVADAHKAQWHTTQEASKMAVEASKIPDRITSGFDGLGRVVAQHMMADHLTQIDSHPPTKVLAHED